LTKVEISPKNTPHHPQPPTTHPLNKGHQVPLSTPKTTRFYAVAANFCFENNGLSK